jgi:superfamily II DNA/RNA helicase
MARNETVPIELAATVKAIVAPMKTSAKLEGLRQLISMLKKENPTGWRMVVFTGRRETQTTIQAFLEELGLKVGIINGSSGQRNQETIARFRTDPPEIRAIVSTEAGSEGINLQIANVLINFDLPWNPMIVEQRIGRVQRLGSLHKNVIIYNVMLAGTFEEYIVGRLMTKLQMATDAIGDIESLLEASGVGDGEEGAGFDEKIRELVVATLAGRDMKAAAERVARSIEAAKTTLEEEKENIEQTLGSQDGYGYVGPHPTASNTIPPGGTGAASITQPKRIKSKTMKSRIGRRPGICFRAKSPTSGTGLCVQRLSPKASSRRALLSAPRSFGQRNGSS